MEWTLTEVPVEGDWVGYLALPPAEGRRRNSPDPQLAMYDTVTDDLDFWILSGRDVTTLRSNNQIGTTERGVIITLSEPTARDETLAIGSDYMREWLKRDEKVALQDFAPLLEAELATNQVRRSWWRP